MADYTIQTPNLGTAPLGTGGDDQRSAFTQLSANWTSWGNAASWDSTTYAVTFTGSILTSNTLILAGSQHSTAQLPASNPVIYKSTAGGATPFTVNGNLIYEHRNISGYGHYFLSSGGAVALSIVDQNATFEGYVRVGGTSAIITSGTGTPEGVVTASIGSLYTRTDGGASTTLYVKESGVGNTGWIAK